MFYAVEILSHKKPLGVPWICGVYDARSKLPVGACAILARARHAADADERAVCVCVVRVCVPRGTPDGAAHYQVFFSLGNNCLCV